MVNRTFLSTSIFFLVASVLVVAAPAQGAWVIWGVVGDVDADFDVDLDDFVVLKSNFGSGDAWAEGDFDLDQDVDLDDFTALKVNFGKPELERAWFLELTGGEPDLNYLIEIKFITATAPYGSWIEVPDYDGDGSYFPDGGLGLMAGVPEPASLSLLAAASLGLLRRRQS